jgi:hypothetical protein
LGCCGAWRYGQMMSSGVYTVDEEAALTGWADAAVAPRSPTARAAATPMRARRALRRMQVMTGLSRCVSGGDIGGVVRMPEEDRATEKILSDDSVSGVLFPASGNGHGPMRTQRTWWHPKGPFSNSAAYAERGRG